MGTSPTLALLLLCTLAASAPGKAREAELGQVSFPNSGAPEAQEPFLRGLAALHSFWYEEAADAFRRAQEIDPDFALAYWGEALTHDHPLWGQQDSEKAQAILARLAPTPAERQALAPTEREKAYLGALEILYGEGDRRSRHRAYSLAMRDASERFSEDPDAAALYALTLQTELEEGDWGVQSRMRSAAILEELFDRYPEHPGVLHYLIHAYDDPLHASLGLRPALTYARVAPAAPHALHMPSHIFVQLGMWEQVAASNRDAYQASVDWVRHKKRERTSEDFHSLSWLHYAYLQLGRAADASETVRTILRAAEETRSPWVTRYRDSMLARHWLETGSWPQDDEGREIRPATGLSEVPAGLALAFGWEAVRQGDFERAREAIVRLSDLAINEEGEGSRSGSRIDRILAQELKGILALAEGRKEQALAELADAAVMERELDPPSGPPHPIKPAQELHAEALLELDRAAEALEGFESALLRTPDRTASLLGAARAAAALGDSDQARRHYRRLAEIWRDAEPGNPALEEARAYLGGSPQALRTRPQR